MFSAALIQGVLAEFLGSLAAAAFIAAVTWVARKVRKARTQQDEPQELPSAAGANEPDPLDRADR